MRQLNEFLKKYLNIANSDKKDAKWHPFLLNFHHDFFMFMFLM